MLSEVIQMEIGKAKTDIHRAFPLELGNTKFSLQIPKQVPFKMNKIVQKQNLNINSRYFRKGSGIKVVIQEHNNINKQIKLPQFSDQYYFGRDQNILRSNGQKLNLAKQYKKGSLISLNKQFYSSNQQISHDNKAPLIVGPRRKAMFQSNNSKNSNSNVFANYYPQQKNTHIKSLQTISLLESKRITKLNEQNQQKQYLFESSSRKNLSPLRSKVYKTTNINSILEQNIFSKIKSQKSLPQRSDSFKKAIENSKEKKLRVNQTQKDKNIKTKQNEYSQGYYDLKERQNVLSFHKSNTTNLKIIKNPQKKIKNYKESNKTAIQCCFKRQDRLGNSDYFIEDIVNNSNMNPLKAYDSEILDMQPF